MSGKSSTHVFQKLARTLHDLTADLARDRAAPSTHPEMIHRLRVQSRRAQALLRWCDTKNTKTLRRFNRVLRVLRQSAGPLRDADILVMHLHTLAPRAQSAPWHLLAGLALQQRRQCAQVWRDQHPSLHQRAARLEKRLARTLRREELFLIGKKSRRKLLVRLADRTRDELSAELPLETLHPLRIAIKKLRYGLESIPDPHSFPCQPWLVWLQEFQSQLGLLRDHQLLKSWLQSLESLETVADFVKSAAWIAFLRSRQRTLVQKIAAQMRLIRRALKDMPDAPFGTERKRPTS
jgi:CHAD domain-containing protein